MSPDTFTDNFFLVIPVAWLKYGIQWYDSCVMLGTWGSVSFSVRNRLQANSIIDTACRPLDTTLVATETTYYSYLLIDIDRKAKKKELFINKLKQRVCPYLYLYEKCYKK